jgi:hypothetical protein
MDGPSPSSVLSCHSYSRAKGSIIDESIHELAASILANLRLPAPTNFIQTMLMEDGYFVGWKFRYDGGFAVFRTGGNAFEFYDEQENLLKTAVVGATRDEAA